MNKEIFEKALRYKISLYYQVEEILLNNCSNFKESLSSVKERIDNFLLENKVGDGYLVIKSDCYWDDHDFSAYLCAEVEKPEERLLKEIADAEKEEERKAKIRQKARERAEARRKANPKKPSPDEQEERKLYEALKKKFESEK